MFTGQRLAKPFILKVFTLGCLAGAVFKVRNRATPWHRESSEALRPRGFEV